MTLSDPYVLIWQSITCYLNHRHIHCVCAPVMLTLVGSFSDGPQNRRAVAVAHLQAAISHINNEAQRRIGDPSDGAAVLELREIVRALCDIVDALQAHEAPSVPA